MRVWLPRLLGLVALAASAAAYVDRIPRLPSTAAVDLLPLYLGGKAWLAGRDPNDDAVLREIFSTASLRLRVGGFFSYYPPTASVLAAPLAMLDYKAAATVWRWASFIGLVVGVWAASGRRWAGAWIAAALLQLRASWIVIPAAQPGPMVVCFTGLALWGLRARKDVPTALGLALGVATKLVPGALVPALVVGRRWRALGAASLLLAALLAAVVLRVPDWSPMTWLRQLLWFVDGEPYLPWIQQESGWVMALWRVRSATIAAVILTAGWVAWRRRAEGAAVPVDDLGALGIAAVGVVMAGSHHYHEALVILPAVAWALGRGGVLTVLVAALLIGFRTWDRTSPPSALHWIPVGWGVFVCILFSTLRGTLRPLRA